MATKAAVSEEEYLRTSFPDLDREYRAGEIEERSLPDYSHGKIQGNIAAFCKPLRKTHRLFASVETRVKLRPGRYVIPDVAIFWPEEPKSRLPDVPPLIAVEILSLDDRLSKVLDKLREYQHWGVRHIWLADPEARLLYTFSAEGLQEVTAYHIPEAGLDVTAEDIFD